MNVLVLSGSRNSQGQTARAAGALVEGLQSAGAKCTAVFLPSLSVERCRQCDDAGWGKCRSAGECVIQDDLPGLIQKIRAADLLVFATPVYFSDLSESMRAMLDRLRRTCVNDAGKVGIKGKPALGICVAGGGGGGSPACCRSLEWTLQTAGFDVVDVIPVRRQNLTRKLDVLKQTGKALAQG